MDASLAGKLVLWHGEPGTGKTYALRAWARSCIDSVDVNYIVDPEVFFSNSGYMMELLTRTPPKELSLFVAEDTGELLARDAKRSIGQGLSRLLNICDGLIGQGMRILFLITTNEDLGSLHPAVVRPGRCHANISFEPFTEDEAARWLSARGFEAELPRARSTIAELYSMINGGSIVAGKKKAFGFIA
ncbi:MAG: AAA family ATPase [Gaiellales bacterium]|nr:MAG: AAA family ATPase [Gaiellales bacterium]